MVWIGLIWLRIGTSGGLLWTRCWNFGFHKMLGSSWVAAQLLAPQEGLGSVSKLVSKWVKLTETLQESIVSNWHQTSLEGITRWEYERLGCAVSYSGTVYPNVRKLRLPDCTAPYLWNSLTYLLTFLRSWALLEEPPIVQPSRTPQHFMEPEGSIQCSQEPSTGPYPEPYQSTPLHPILSL
jgi:hypothetical protein